MSNTYGRDRQFGAQIRRFNGNFKVHTRSGVFECLNGDAEAIATGILNTGTITFGSYCIAPDCIDIIEGINAPAKKDSARDSSGTGSGPGKGPSSDSKK